MHDDDDDDDIPTLWHKSLPAPFIIRILAAYDMMEQSISLGTNYDFFIQLIDSALSRFPFYLVTRKEIHMF
jgi:hypothetical protein